MIAPRASFVAAVEGRLRPFLSHLPPSLLVRLYSRGRSTFLGTFASSRPRRAYSPEGLGRTLWGLRFQAPLMNAAGMFKNGEGYAVVARQGAGAFLAGTTTHRPRRGNRRCGVATPFAPYPRSGAASNWLGLPNPGHAAVARRLGRVRRVDGCPVGASVTADPEPGVAEAQRLDELVAGMGLYAEAGVDFLEMNESCPNTEAEEATFEGLLERLQVVSDRFLGPKAADRRRPPVVVKFSCDTELERVPELVDALLDLGYDGVNFGNTSTAYGALRSQIRPAEQGTYDYFIKTFGGGVSGRPLKELSLSLASVAVARVAEKAGDREFHVLRTGGVETAADLRASAHGGIPMTQWYSGYFDAFADHGHDVYRRIFDGLAGPPPA
ncbi:MAG: hypothetical protein AAGN66_18490 [Acidobacteriota bacterium]